MPTPMETLLTNLGTVFTFFMSRFTQILGLFITEPILVFLLGIMVVGAVIGLTMRLIHRG